MKPNYLFVCIGNICRSTMAHYIAEQMFEDKINVQSAGVSPHGYTAYPQTVKTLRNLFKIESSHHKPQDFYQLNLESFDKIFILDDGVYTKLSKQYPHLNLINWSVEDPYYGDQNLFNEIALEIVEKVKSIKI